MFLDVRNRLLMAKWFLRFSTAIALIMWKLKLRNTENHLLGKLETDEVFFLWIVDLIKNLHLFHLCSRQTWRKRLLISWNQANGFSHCIMTTETQSLFQWSHPSLKIWLRIARMVVAVVDTVCWESVSAIQDSVEMTAVKVSLYFF